jgi:hypothetical protein
MHPCRKLTERIRRGLFEMGLDADTVRYVRAEVEGVDRGILTGGKPSRERSEAEEVLRSIAASLILAVDRLYGVSCWLEAECPPSWEVESESIVSGLTRIANGEDATIVRLEEVEPPED